MTVMLRLRVNELTKMRTLAAVKSYAKLTARVETNIATVSHALRDKQIPGPGFMAQLVRFFPAIASMSCSRSLNGETPSAGYSRGRGCCHPTGHCLKQARGGICPAIPVARQLAGPRLRHAPCMASQITPDGHRVSADAYAQVTQFAHPRIVAFQRWPSWCNSSFPMSLSRHLRPSWLDAPSQP